MKAGSSSPDGDADGAAADMSFQSNCGRVRATPPTNKKATWRLEYVMFGQRRQPSGGATRESAELKMAWALRQLDSGLSQEMTLSLGEDAIIDWLRPEHPRRKSKPWSGGTRHGHLFYVNAYFLPILGRVRVELWSGQHYRAVMGLCPTAKESEQVKRRLSALVNWLARTGYLTPEQAFPVKFLNWYAPAGYVERPTRTVEGTESGEDGDYLPLEDAMDAEHLAAVGDALQTKYPHGKLYAELCAATGLRQGCAFALSSTRIDLEQRRVRVKWQWNSKLGQLTKPKGGKRRTTLYVEGPTITGYDLDAALRARIGEVEVEHTAGRNPHRLMFPATRGGNLDASNFDSRIWIPAMTAASIPAVNTLQVLKGGNQRLLYRYTNHSLRDRYAISALNEWGYDLDELCVTGGWSDTNVIMSRYYGVARGVLDRIQKKTASEGQAAARGRGR